MDRFLSQVFRLTCDRLLAYYKPNNIISNKKQLCNLWPQQQHAVQTITDTYTDKYTDRQLVKLHMPRGKPKISHATLKVR